MSAILDLSRVMQNIHVSRETYPDPDSARCLYVMKGASQFTGAPVILCEFPPWRSYPIPKGPSELAAPQVYLSPDGIKFVQMRTAIRSVTDQGFLMDLRAPGMDMMEIAIEEKRVVLQPAFHEDQPHGEASLELERFAPLEMPGFAPWAGARFFEQGAMVVWIKGHFEAESGGAFFGVTHRQTGAGPGLGSFELFAGKKGGVYRIAVQSAHIEDRSAVKDPFHPKPDGFRFILETNRPSAERLVLGLHHLEDPTEFLSLCQWTLKALGIEGLHVPEHPTLVELRAISIDRLQPLILGALGLDPGRRLIEIV